MKQTSITPDLNAIPEQFRNLIENSAVYDSSCSPEAQVLYIDRDGGYYLKSASKGTLQTEAKLTEYFHIRGLAAEVAAYSTENDRDWLLTTAVPGTDCTHADILSQPARLCDILAETLRSLHELSYADCPVQNRLETYFATAEQNYHAGLFDASYCPAEYRFSTPQEAWIAVSQGKRLLKNDSLIHGDYCLPNIIFKNWNLSGFIDLGNGGVGDRHIDLFWGAWTLKRNLGTEAYRERFFDAYGRDRINFDALRIVSAAETFG